MNILNDLPFYIVIVAVFLNVLLGVFTEVDFVVLMLRSIVVTIVFSVLGLVLSEILKKTFDSSQKEARDKSGTLDPAEEQQGGTIDIQVPPMDERELFNYRDENTGNDEDFLEVNPAYLHKFGQEEQNE